MFFLRLDQYQKYISYYQHIPTYEVRLIDVVVSFSEFGILNYWKEALKPRQFYERSLCTLN